MILQYSGCKLSSQLVEYLSISGEKWKQLQTIQCNLRIYSLSVIEHVGKKENVVSWKFDSGILQNESQITGKFRGMNVLTRSIKYLFTKRILSIIIFAQRNTYFLRIHVQFWSPVQQRFRDKFRFGFIVQFDWIFDCGGGKIACGDSSSSKFSFSSRPPP